MSVQLELFEEKNRREAAIYTALVTGAVLCLFYFITIFKETDQLKPDYGIEVNFGTSDKGSGDIQTYNKANDLKEKIESAPEASKAKKDVAPPVVKPVEPKVEKVVKAPAKEETAVTSKVESPVKIKEAPAKAKPTPVKPAETAKPAPAKVEPVKPTPVPPKPDAGSLYSKPGAKTGGNGTVGTTSKSGGNNNGDGAKGEVGDKGDPKGKIDAPLYSGKPGGGGGTGTASGNSLNLTGWTWSKKPVVNDNSDETGNIKFEIKVDDQGEILSVRVLSTTVSQSVVNLYKRAIEKVSFVPTGSGNRPAVSTGTINIKINPRN
jgi:periplasmic protein TonB